jgi:hypothetical protein
MGTSAALRRDCLGSHRGQYPKIGHEKTAPTMNQDAYLTGSSTQIRTLASSLVVAR